LQHGVDNQAVNRALGSPGQPIDPRARAFLETRLGHDFSQVRIHSDQEAAHHVNAAAFTVGHDVVFGDIAPALQSKDGLLLLAHELAHVVQQRRGGAPPPLAGSAASEADAARAARDVVGGRCANVRAATGRGLARVRPEDLEDMRQWAWRAMEQEQPQKSSASAAAEGAYMGRLASRGLTPVNLNEFTRAEDFPYLDIVSSEGFAQIKARLDTTAVEAYVKDVWDLANPQGTAAEAAETIIGHYDELKRRGAWPQENGVDVAPDADALTAYMARTAKLGVPANRVKAVRAALRQAAAQTPTDYGLPADATPGQIEAMANRRVQSVGMQRGQLDRLGSDYRASREFEAVKQARAAGAQQREEDKETGRWAAARGAPEREKEKQEAAERRESYKKDARKRSKEEREKARAEKKAAKSAVTKSTAAKSAVTKSTAAKSAVTKSTAAKSAVTKSTAAKSAVTKSAEPEATEVQPPATVASDPAVAEVASAEKAVAVPATATKPGVKLKAEAAAKPEPEVEPAAKVKPARPKPAGQPPSGPTRRPSQRSAPGGLPSPPRRKATVKGPAKPAVSQDSETPPSTVQRRAGATRAGGITSDTRHGLGVGGETGLSTSLHTEGGASLGAHFGGGGHWRVNVFPVPDHPGMVDVVTAIDLTVSAGASIGRGVHISGGVSRNQVAESSHRLTEQDARQYLAVMNGGGNGGTLPEHELLRVGLTKGWPAAAERWATMQGGEVRQGDTLTLSSGSTAHGGVEGEAGLGAASVQAGYGRSATDEVSLTIANQDGEHYELGLTVNHVAGESGTFGLTFAEVGGAVGTSKHVSTGDSVYFTVPISDKAAVAEIRGARTTAALAALKRKYGAYLRGTAERSGSGSASTVDVSLLGAHATLGGAGAVDQAVDYDPEGNKTGSSIIATSTSGGTVGAGGYGFGDEQHEEFQASVSEHGSASGGQLAVGASKHETSSSVSIPGLGKSKTTSGPTVYYENAAFDRIVGEAHEGTVWWRHVLPGSHLAPDWRALQNRLIRVSHWVDDERGGHWQYDATKVEAAIGAFTAHDTSGRIRNVEAIIQGTTGGADLSAEGSFPGELASYEQDFRQYVVVDPVGNSKAVRAVDDAQIAAVKSPESADSQALAGMVQAAIAELNDIKVRLDQLYAAVKSHESAFTDQATRADMLVRIGRRRTAAVNEIAAMNNVITPRVQVLKAEPESAAQAGAADTGDAVSAAPAAEVDEGQRSNAEASAKQNLDEMWALSNGLWSTLGHVETLINQGDFAANVDAINKDLAHAETALSELRAKRKANAEAIQRFGLGAWLSGPDPEEVHGPRFRRAYDATR
jgi:hypothetical protein